MYLGEAFGHEFTIIATDLHDARAKLKAIPSVAAWIKEISEDDPTVNIDDRIHVQKLEMAGHDVWANKS